MHIRFEAARSAKGKCGRFRRGRVAALVSPVLEVFATTFFPQLLL